MMKYYIGDRVRIINTACIDDCALNKVGVIVRVSGPEFDPTYVIDMGEPRRPWSDSDNDATCWWLRGCYIEYANDIGAQLLLFGDL